ncbi:hypothetical protein Tco_1095188, partial [Tanacetum coccineum]
VDPYGFEGICKDGDGVFLEYYCISRKIVEVDPIYEREFKRSDFRKLPVLMMNWLKGCILTLSVPVDGVTQKWHRCADTTLLAVLQRNVYESAVWALDRERDSGCARYYEGEVKGVLRGDDDGITATAVVIVK